MHSLQQQKYLKGHMPARNTMAQVPMAQEHAGTTFSPEQTPTLRDTMHSVIQMDGRTDGQTDDVMMSIADHTV